MEKQWVEGQGLMVKDSDVSIENSGNSSALDAGLCALLDKWQAEADELLDTSNETEDSTKGIVYKNLATDRSVMIKELEAVIAASA